MTTKAELEQENEILSAELEEAQRTIATMRVELDAARGRTELVTKGLEDDLQAIGELRNPPPLPGPPAESALEIVRANQRERDELQTRLRAANNIVSRIAAIVSVASWDAEGTEIREAVQRLAHVGFHAGRRRKAVIAELQKLSTVQRLAAGERHELQGWVRALDWIAEQAGKVPTDERSIPLTAPAGMRCTQGDGTDSVVIAVDSGYLHVYRVRDEDVVHGPVMISMVQVATARDTAA